MTTSSAKSTTTCVVLTSLAFLLSLIAGGCAAENIEWAGIPDDASSATNNTAELNTALASLRPGDRLAIPNRTYWLAGGVHASGLVNATIQLDGTLRFLAGRKGWPVEAQVLCLSSCLRSVLQTYVLLPSFDSCPTSTDKTRTCVQKAILISNAVGLTLTSTGDGIVDGNGHSWWGYIQCELVVHAWG